MDSISTTNEFDNDGKLPLKTKIAFATGMLGNMLLYGTVYSSLTIYYNIKLQADAGLLGIAWLIFLIWNAINDPWFGYISDNTRSKLGRRIPYIRYGSIIYGLLFILSWFPFAQIGDQVGLFINFLVVLFVFDTLVSIVGTSFLALPNELTLRSDERAKLGFWASIFNIISLSLQFGIPAIFLSDRSIDLNPAFKPIMIIIGVSCSILMFTSSFFMKENKFAQIQEKEKFFEGLKLTFSNKPFVIFEISNFSITLLTTTMGTGMLYYIKYVLQVDVAEMFVDITMRWDIRIGLILLLIMAILGAFLTLKKVSNNLKSLSILSFSFISIGFLGFFLSGVHEHVWFTIPFWGISIYGAASIMVLLPAVTGDVTDYDETLTGRRREGSYAGFNALVTKPAISIANWSFLGLIGLFGFNQELLIQSDMARWGILFAFTLLPAIFAMVSAIAFKHYKLQGDWWDEKKIEIKELHEKKEKEYLKYIGNLKGNQDI